MIYVYKFACGRRSGTVSFETTEMAEGFAAGYRACGEDVCSPVAAYAQTEIDMMMREENQTEVARIISEVDAAQSPNAEVSQ